MKFVSLIAAAAVAAVAAPAQAAPAPNGQDGTEIRCKRMASTGSRVKRNRVCLTVAEWQRQAEEARRTATEIQDRGSIDPAGDPQ